MQSTTRRGFLSFLGALPLVGGWFAKAEARPTGNGYKYIGGSTSRPCIMAEGTGKGLITFHNLSASRKEPPPVSLLVNGVEVPFDCTKTLNIEFRGNVDRAVMGPVHLAVKPKERIDVFGNAEHPEATYFGVEHEDLSQTRLCLTGYAAEITAATVLVRGNCAVKQGEESAP